MSTTLTSEEDIRNDQAHIAGLVDELATLASNLFAGEARFVALIGEFDRLVDCRSLAGRGACRRRDLAAASDGQPPRPDIYDGDYDDGGDTTVPDLPVDPYSRPPLTQVEGGPAIPNPVLFATGV